MRAPACSTSDSMTSMRVTSRAGSMIWQEWITGFGTVTRSEPTSPSGELIAMGRDEQPTGRVAHVAAQRHRVVDLTGVHRAVVAADVPVAEQSGPALLQLRGVRLGVVLQLSDVSQWHGAPLQLASSTRG